MLSYLTPQERGQLDRLILSRDEASGEFQKYSDWYQSHIPKTFGYPKHIQFICELIDKVVAGDIQRLALSTPPGHGKSDTVTRRLPLYWGPRHPWDVIVATGYNQTFAEKNLSFPTRELAREYHLLHAKSNALDEWRFKNQCRFVARGVGTPPTGYNPISLLIADDPIKDREQVNSEIERQNVWDWWVGSIVQRFWPETRAIVIATRWHEDDLIGRLKAQNTGEWTFVNLPAIAEDEDVLGRTPGEELWEKKPIEFLRQLQGSDLREFESLFQGNPTPREGSFFKIAQLQVVDVVPAGLFKKGNLARAWDIAATGGGGDWTAGVLMGEYEGLYYVLDVVRGQWATDERDATIRLTAELDGNRVKVLGPKEVGSAGKDFGVFFIRKLAGFPVQLMPTGKSKETRVDPYSSQVNGGNVRLLRAQWNKDYVEELRQFPSGKHDDQVDASGDAFKAVAVPIQFNMLQGSTSSPQPEFKPALQSGIPTTTPQQRTPQTNGQFRYTRR